MTPTRLLPAAGLAAALLTLTACGGTSNDSLSPSSDGRGAVTAEEPAVASDDALTADLAGDAERSGAARPANAAVRTRSVISTGTLSLRADDVEDALFDVRRVVDQHRGEVTDEETGTDDGGDVDRSRLTIRVPSDSFDEAMTDLGEVADLVEAARQAEDVTTQMIDNEVRIRAQRKSLRRIETLLARAEKIGDIVAIEAQLTSRQAELDSLEQQQAWLSDQTELATIALYLERTPEEEQKEDDDRAAFLVGLSDGWSALQSSAAGLAQVVGAVLPFVVLLALVGAPLALVRRARRTARTPSGA